MVKGIYRHMVLLVLAFLLLELLDPTTFIGIRSTPAQRLIVGPDTVIHQTVPPTVVVQVQRFERVIVAKHIVRHLPQIIGNGTRFFEPETAFPNPPPKYLFMPLKLCPDDELA